MLTARIILPPSFTSLDHLISAGEQRRRHLEAEHQTNIIAFTEVNSPVTVNNAYQWTQTSLGGPTTTQQPAAVHEDRINPLNITTPLNDTSAEGQQTQTTNCQTPPQNPGMGTYSCTLLWEWHLFKQ
jgi:hypothetical protein